MPGKRRVPERRRPISLKERTFLSISLAALLLVTGLFPIRALQIEELRKQKVVLIRSIEPGDRFSLMYRHSVERSLVWDHIRIDGQYQMVLEETVFDSSNTGLPSVLGAGERYTRGKNDARISNMHRVLPAIEIWVNRAYDNTLAFENRKILLPELAGDTLLRLDIRKMTLARWVTTKILVLFNRLAKR